MANTTIGKGNLLHDCKLFGTGKVDLGARPGCKTCKTKYQKQFEACASAIAAIVKSKKTDTKPARVKGLWGYAAGCFTDIFCNAICENPLTMNMAAAIIDPVTKNPIGPHPKCKARLLSEKLAAEYGHLIYMRVYPKGHKLAGQLTPAAKKIADLKAAEKTESKKAA